MEAGKRRLAGDTARAATNGEVKDLRREAQELKAVVAEQALELRLLKKSMIADGGDEEWDTPPPRNLRSFAWSSNPTCPCAGRRRSWGSSLQGSTAVAIDCQTGGPEALDDRAPRPKHVWNRIRRMVNEWLSNSCEL